MSLHSKRLILINQICRYLMNNAKQIVNLREICVTKLDSYKPKSNDESSFNYFIWIGLLDDNRIGTDKCHYEVLIDPNFKVHVMLHFEGAPKRYCDKVRNYIKKQNISLTEVEPKSINPYTKPEDKKRWVWYKYMNKNSAQITSGDASAPDCPAEISLNQNEQKISDITLEQIASSLSDLINSTKQILGAINEK